MAPRILIATGLYFLVGLTLGFALGSVRGLVLEPLVGPTIATALELPVILTLLWIACGWCVRVAQLPEGPWPRLAMGALWFLLFLAAEFAIGALVRGWSPARTLSHMRTVPGLMGLVGFALAALFPLLAPQRKSRP